MVSLKDFSKDSAIFRDFSSFISQKKKPKQTKRTLEVEKHLIKQLVEML